MAKLVYDFSEGAQGSWPKPKGVCAGRPPSSAQGRKVTSLPTTRPASTPPPSSQPNMASAAPPSTPRSLINSDLGQGQTAGWTPQTRSRLAADHAVLRQPGAMTQWDLDARALESADRHYLETLAMPDLRGLTDGLVPMTRGVSSNRAGSSVKPRRV